MPLLRVNGFQEETSTLRGPELLFQSPPRNAKRARLAAFDKIGNVFSLIYSQMIAQQLRQLNVYCRHLYFIKIGDKLKCCVFISRECSMAFSGPIMWNCLTKDIKAAQTSEYLRIYIL